MRTALVEELYNDFPDLLKLEDGGFCAINCGDGWEPTLRRLFETINDEMKSPRMAQVKERWMCEDKMKRLLHNSCRKLESFFGLQSYTLYKWIPRKYVEYTGTRVKFMQIKEKFGGLRASYKTTPLKLKTGEMKKLDYMDALKKELEFLGVVRGAYYFAKMECIQTCENDGDPGELYQGSSWRVLCPTCRDKINKL